MKRIGYVSSAAAGGEESNFERQRASLLRRAEASGFAIDEWVEEARSGLRPRPGLEALLARAEAGETMQIHVARLDRVGRNAKAVDAALRRAQEAGSEIVFVDEPLGPAAQLVAGIAMAMEEHDQKPRREARRG